MRGVIDSNGAISMAATSLCDSGGRWQIEPGIRKIAQYFHAVDRQTVARDIFAGSHYTLRPIFRDASPLNRVRFKLMLCLAPPFLKGGWEGFSVSENLPMSL